jgi:hypothetical protein
MDALITVELANIQWQGPLELLNFILVGVTSANQRKKDSKRDVMPPRDLKSYSWIFGF